MYSSEEKDQHIYILCLSVKTSLDLLKMILS